MCMAPAPRADGDPFWGSARSRRRGPRPGARGAVAVDAGVLGRPAAVSRPQWLLGCPTGVMFPLMLESLPADWRSVLGRPP